MDTETIVDGRITVQLLGSGWAAVHLVTVQCEDGSTYPDVQNVGFGRFATRAEAVVEARTWAAHEELTLSSDI